MAEFKNFPERYSIICKLNYIDWLTFTAGKKDSGIHISYLCLLIVRLEIIIRHIARCLASLYFKVFKWLFGQFVCWYVAKDFIHSREVDSRFWKTSGSVVPH